MMTREEFDREWDKIDIIEGCTIGYHCEQTDKLIDKYIDQLQQHIKSLETQLSNTEQLTCGTCDWKYVLGFKNNAPCGKCTINPFINNHHKLKDTQ